MMVIKSKKLKLDDVKKSEVISFFDSDYPEGFNQEHDDLMVNIVTIHNYAV